ncbi:hypothetical protein [uncultured Nostoc sp.]|uniref:hypothetical protein n=1 Tax=uncultured Nostoc sp. TaxID=340711 RepID=UPI0035CABDF2
MQHGIADDTEELHFPLTQAVQHPYLPHAARPPQNLYLDRYDSQSKRQSLVVAENWQQKEKPARC